MKSFIVALLATLLFLTGVTGAYAFGGSFISGAIKPIGKSALAACNFEPYNAPFGMEAEVSFLRTSDVQAQAAGGTYYQGNTIVPKPGGPITANELLNDCDFSSVTIVSQNGADSNYTADGYIGIVFRAITNGETDLYEYEIALSGPSTTVRVNTRTLIASNNAPTAVAGPAQTVASAANVSLNGTGSSDPENSALTYSWTQASGPSVTLTGAATASPSFTAPTLAIGAADQALTFQLIVNDGTQDSAASTVQITVTAPPNTAPTANAGPAQSVASNASVSLDGTASSANDPGQTLTYSWTQSGGTTVSLSNAATAAPSFTAPTLAIGAADEVLTFQLIVNDGFANSAASTVQITVTAPPNTAPTANAGPAQSVASNASVSLDGTASSANDPGQTLTYNWTQASGRTVSLSNAGTASPSFTAPTLAIGAADEVLTFQLTVNDGFANSAASTVQITVIADPNNPPTANAGPAQSVGSGASVSLDGTASSANDPGQTLTYNWTQPGGTPVSLSNAATATPSFTAPTLAIGAADEVLTFQLLVNDGSAIWAASMVQITVTAPPNTAPTANAGPAQSVGSGASVSLNGTASSDPDGQTLTYSWTQASGTPVPLSNAATASPSFTAPTLAIGAADEVLTFELTVSDGLASSATSTVQITVTSDPNNPPTANAGADQSVVTGTTVTLDGTASSANDPGQVLSYAWTQTGGPSVALSNASAAAPDFVAPALVMGAPDEVLTFSLMVNDGLDTSVADTVQITVTAIPNTAPTANAGADQSVVTGTTVTLDGAASSANDPGQVLSYAWTQTGGPSVTLSNAAAAAPDFVAPALAIGAPDEVLTFDLTVNDGLDTSVADTVQITVTAIPNTAPTANAGADQSVVTGTTVTLDGAASSANDPGQVLSYAWTQTGGPSVTLSNAADAAPDFVAPALAIGAPDEVLTFDLTVNDGLATSVVDRVQITVRAVANTVPTANAGADQSVTGGDRVSLDGSGSAANDPGQVLSYAWTQTGGPAVALSDAAAVAPEFAAPVLAIGAPDEVLTFSLTVNDGLDTSAVDTVQITVTAIPNTAPTANAGADIQTAAGEQVQLDGVASSANDPDQVLSYVWTQTGGPVVTLSDPTGRTPRFVAPVPPAGQADLELAFQLVVNDGIDASAPDSVVVTVQALPVDATQPTVTLSYAGDSYYPGGVVAIAIAFSEPVTGLTGQDLATNGRVVSLSGKGARYTATIATSDTGDNLNVGLPAGAAEDLAGNPNMAAAALSIRANRTEQARKVAAEGMKERGRSLIAAQPNLRSFFGPAGGSKNVMMLQDAGNFDLAYLSEGSWWVTAQGRWTSADDADSEYANLAVGAHLYRGQDNIIGVMLQVDHSKTDSDSPDGRFKGDGWLVGPYWVGKLPEQPLYFSASYMWGRTDNKVRLDGRPEDDFDGLRRLLTAGVEGRYELKPGRTLIPSLDLAHLTDTVDAYADSVGDHVPGQEVKLTEARFGLGIEQAVVVSSGDMVLRGGIAGTYSKVKDAFSTDEDWRGGLDIGVDYDLPDLGSLRFSAYYDGLWQDDYDARGLSMSYRMDF